MIASTSGPLSHAVWDYPGFRRVVNTSMMPVTHKSGPSFSRRTAATADPWVRCRAWFLASRRLHERGKQGLNSVLGLSTNRARIISEGPYLESRRCRERDHPTPPRGLLPEDK